MTAATGLTKASDSGTPLVEIVVAEDLDARATARLRSLMSDALALQPDNLIVDLDQCSIITAETVQILLEAHRRTWQAGGRFALRSPSPRVRRILELAKADRVLRIVGAPTTRPDGALPPTT